MKYCVNCRKSLSDNAVRCSGCGGTEFSNEILYSTEETKDNPAAIICLFLGIYSIVMANMGWLLMRFGWFYFAIPWTSALVGLILYVVSVGSVKKSARTAGLICSFIGMGLSVLLCVITGMYFF